MGLENVGLAFGLAIAAGLSTSVGASLCFCVRVTNTKFLAAALGVSAGVMIYVSFVEIFTAKSIQGFKDAGNTPAEAYRYATLTFFGGLLLTWMLDRLVHLVLYISDVLARRQRQQRDRQPAGGTSTVQAVAVAGASGEACLSNCSQRQPQVDVEMAGPSGHAGEPPSRDRGSPSTKQHHHQHACSGDLTHHSSQMSMQQDGCQELAEDRHHPDLVLPPNTPAEVLEMVKADRCHQGLQRMSLLSALAVGIHNLPEGLATFVGTIASPKAGIAIAIAIALHNIPEGIVVCMPIYYATGSKWKGFFWSTVSGVSEIVGAVIGYLILSSNAANPPLMYAMIFGIVAGMMVYISVQELIPTALQYDKHNHFVSRCAMLGMAIMAASLVMFQI